VPVEIVENFSDGFLIYGLLDDYLWKTCGKARAFFHRVIILNLKFSTENISFPQIYGIFSTINNYFSTK
jgi:hypothetical protein